ncbi:hypothetical protein [Micromonospora sp. NPDC049662]|uniref:hypothetical protein n=1 Tax=Micromonospora sp. NPDC049662 TaxID=3155397 RepID=UPI0034368312
MDKDDYAQVADAIRKARAELISPNGPLGDSASPRTTATIADARAVLDVFVQQFADHLASTTGPAGLDRDRFVAACVAALDQPMVLDPIDEFKVWEREHFKTRYEQSRIPVAQLAREIGVREKHLRDVLREAGVRLGRRGRPPATTASPPADGQAHSSGAAGNTAHPPALAKAFHPPGPLTGTSTLPAATAHPTHPPQPTTPTRRTR